MKGSSFTDRLVIIHYTSVSFVGGVEVLINDFLKLASSLGNKVRLIVGKGIVSNLPNVTLVDIPLLDANFPDIKYANGLLMEGKSNLKVDNICNEIYSRLSSCIKSGDIIHAHNIITNSYNLPLVIALYRLMLSNEQIGMLAWCHDIAWGKYVTQPHDFSIYPLTLLTKIWPRTHYIALSLERKTVIQRRLNVSDKGITVITPYIDPQRVLGLSDRTLEILNVAKVFECDINIFYPCRISRRKNIEYALHMVKCIKNMGNSVRLLVTGPHSPHRTEESNAYKEELLDMIENLGLSEEIVFINSVAVSTDTNSCVANEHISEIYRAIDLVLSTSYEEGFGISLVEAVMAGVPVLASSDSTVAINRPYLSHTFKLTDRPSDAAKFAVSLARKRRDRKRQLLLYGNKLNHWTTITQLAEGLVDNDRFDKLLMSK